MCGRIFISFTSVLADARLASLTVVTDNASVSYGEVT